MNQVKIEAAITQLIHELKQLNIQLTPFIDITWEMQYEPLDCKSFTTCFSGWPSDAPIASSLEDSHIFTDHPQNNHLLLEALFPNYHQNFKDYKLQLNLEDLFFNEASHTKVEALRLFQRYLKDHPQQFSVGLRQSTEQESESLRLHILEGESQESIEEAIGSWYPALNATNANGQSVRIESMDNSIENMLPKRCVARIIEAIKKA